MTAASGVEMWIMPEHGRRGPAMTSNHAPEDCKETSMETKTRPWTRMHSRWYRHESGCQVFRQAGDFYNNALWVAESANGERFGTATTLSLAKAMVRTAIAEGDA